MTDRLPSVHELFNYFTYLWLTYLYTSFFTTRYTYLWIIWYYFLRGQITYYGTGATSPSKYIKIVGVVKVFYLNEIHLNTIPVTC